MSDNNLVNIKGMSDGQIMQWAIGQDDVGSNMGSNIPRLCNTIVHLKMTMVINDTPVGHFWYL